MALANAEEVLLDKIVAVINSKIISLSEVKRIEETIDARMEISPFIYNKKKLTSAEIVQILIKSTIVREKISGLGYVINDEAVDSRIKMTEERLGLKRSDLLQFLKTKKITYEEYFELIRESMEYNIFTSRIIAPLISVTEQEIKNEFYKLNSNNKALSFRYNLVDFYVNKNNVVSFTPNNFISAVKDLQLTGKLPAEYETTETNALDNLSEDSLSKELSSSLKKTDEGGFTPPLEINGYFHIFYVQKKDLVESQEFLKAKEKIQNDLMNSKSQSVTKNWFEREYANYFIKVLN